MLVSLSIFYKVFEIFKGFLLDLKLNPLDFIVFFAFLTGDLLTFRLYPLKYFSCITFVLLKDYLCAPFLGDKGGFPIGNLVFVPF